MGPTWLIAHTQHTHPVKQYRMKRTTSHDLKYAKAIVLLYLTKYSKNFIIRYYTPRNTCTLCKPRWLWQIAPVHLRSKYLQTVWGRRADKRFCWHRNAWLDLQTQSHLEPPHYLQMHCKRNGPWTFVVLKCVAKFCPGISQVTQSCKSRVRRGFGSQPFEDPIVSITEPW